MNMIYIYVYTYYTSSRSVCLFSRYPHRVSLGGSSANTPQVWYLTPDRLYIYYGVCTLETGWSTPLRSLESGVPSGVSNISNNNGKTPFVLRTTEYFARGSCPLLACSPILLALLQSRGSVAMRCLSYSNKEERDCVLRVVLNDTNHQLQWRSGPRRYWGKLTY